MTIQQAETILSKFPTDDEHHTVKHSRDVLSVGRLITGTRITESLECALLLHDIGHFFEDNTDNSIGHGMLARLFLEEQGINSPEILLPVAFHEADDHMEEMCCRDEVFQQQNQEVKREILWNCRVVCEADIISHMQEILREQHSDDEVYSKHFIDLLKIGQLPPTNAVGCLNDKILYLLCGLPLICLQGSLEYLKKERSVQQLISRLPHRCRDSVSKIVYEKYGL